MRLICMSAARMESGLLRTMVVGAAIAALSAALAAPARAQEAAPAAGGDAAQAASQTGGGDGAVNAPPAAADGGAALTGGDIEPVAARHRSAGLYRRANIKTLIANTAGKPAGLQASARTRLPLSPSRPAIEAATPRKAIGATMPGLRLPGQGNAGFPIQAGARLTALGAAAGHGGLASHQIPAPVRQIPIPTNAGPALRGAAINGTAIRRVASGPGTIGGPAKGYSGINGTLMKPKY